MHGVASTYVTLIQYLILLYKKDIADHVKANGYDLGSQPNDLYFMKTVFSMMPVVFGIEPNIRVDDFFVTGMPEKKVQLANNLIAAVKAKSHEFKTRRDSLSRVKSVTFRQEDSIA